MRTITFSIFLSLLSISAIAQKTRTVGEFTGIESSSNFEIILTEGEPGTLTIDAKDEIEPLIKTEVQNGILHFSYVKSKMQMDSSPKITLQVKNLKSIEVSGVSTVKGTNQIIADKIKLDISGAGEIEMDIKANKISVDQSGAGNVNLKGSTNVLKSDISGAGNLKAADLVSDTVSIKISGAGAAKVHAVKSLEGDVSGAGSIHYTGNPEIKNVKVSGIGSVHPSSSSGTTDTTEIKLNNKRILIIGDEHEHKKEKNKRSKGEAKEHHHKSKKNFHHWSGIGFGVNGYLTSDNKMSLPGNNYLLDLNYNKSCNFILNFAEKDIHLYKNFINLVTGFGFEFNSYSFKNNISLDPLSQNVSASLDSLIDYKKNKLKMSFINVPLLLEFNTSRNPRKAFHLAAGMIFGYKMGSRTKQEFEINKREIEVKVKDDFNLSPFRSSFTVRAGYSNVTLFATYALTPLFEKGKGPTVYPFSVGLCINPD
jgi:hypothetical protein